MGGLVVGAYLTLRLPWPPLLPLDWTHRALPPPSPHRPRLVLHEGCCRTASLPSLPTGLASQPTARTRKPPRRNRVRLVRTTSGMNCHLIRVKTRGALCHSFASESPYWPPWSTEIRARCAGKACGECGLFMVSSPANLLRMDILLSPRIARLPGLGIVHDRTAFNDDTVRAGEIECLTTRLHLPGTRHRFALGGARWDTAANLSATQLSHDVLRGIPLPNSHLFLVSSGPTSGHTTLKPAGLFRVPEFPYLHGAAIGEVA